MEEDKINKIYVKVMCKQVGKIQFEDITKRE